MKIKRFLFEGEILRLMGITVMVKPLALVSQVLIARFFGASAQLDAYTFSLFLVTFLGLTLNGVFSSVVIPQITRLRSVKDPAGLSAYQNAVGLLFYLPVVLVLLLFILKGEFVINLVGANLPDETKEYARGMLRILAWPGLLFCMVKFNSSLLNLNKVFRIPAMMLPLHSVFLFAGIIGLQRPLGIWALPVGWSLSYLIQSLVIGFHILKRKIITFTRPKMSLGESSVLWGLCWAVFLAQSLLMINTFVDKWFATGLPVGSISYVGYAMVLVHFGQQTFSLSLIVVMFTKMSEYLADSRVAECDNYIQTNLKKVSNFVVPISLALFVASPEIVSVLFERGAFTAYDSERTSATLSMYLLGLPAIVLNGIVARIFHSLQKMKERIWLTLQYLVTNVIGNVLLVKALATVGLAISSTVAINIHLLISLIWIFKFGIGLKPGRYLTIIIQAYVMGLITFGVYYFTGLGGWINSALVSENFGSILARGSLKVAVVLALFAMQYGTVLVVRKRFR